jgi:hypothetical protein
MSETGAAITAVAKRAFTNNAHEVYQPLANGLARHLSPLIVDRERLQVLCRRRGTLVHYGSSDVFDIDPPNPADEPMESLGRKVGEHHLSQPFVGELPDATLVGRYPMAIHDRRLVLEAIGRSDVAILNLYYTVAEDGPVRPTGGRRHLDCAVLLYNCWNRGYFHWVAETLTRFEGIERYREHTGREPTLVLGSEPPEFQTESLRLLSYDEEDWIEWDGTTTTVDRLVVPSMRHEVRRGVVASPFACGWLRRRLRGAATEQVDTDRLSPRVYVSRSDANARRVVNEPELSELLSAYGFETYRLADMSVAETIALFSQAECIVGPHGAGLTDMLYAEDASVIELFRGTDGTRAYFVLANQLGHRYRHLQCEPRGVDLVVDLADLETTVAEEITDEEEGSGEYPSLGTRTDSVRPVPAMLDAVVGTPQ